MHSCHFELLYTYKQFFEAGFTPPSSLVLFRTHGQFVCSFSTSSNLQTIFVQKRRSISSETDFKRVSFFVVVLRLRLTVVCLICFSFGREKDISNLISNSYFQKEDLSKQAPGRD